MDKLYLYDIQNIKKKRDTHHGQNRQMVRNPLLLKWIVIRILKKSKSIICWVNNE